MSTIKISQYIHFPNATELGMGNTHETYMLVSSDTDLSEMFPPKTEVDVIEISSKKIYKLKSTSGGEFRVNQMGEIYRDYKLLPGDKIIFSKVETEDDSKIFFSVKTFNRVVLVANSNGVELFNLDRLSVFSVGSNKFELKIYNEGVEQDVLIEFKESKKKRSDSPVTTDYYKVLINGNVLANGKYVLTISDKSLLENFDKSDFNVIEYDDSILPGIDDHSKINKGINLQLNFPLQQIFYGAPGTGKSHRINEMTDGESVIRTTFHPDYDYASFVGCYKPYKDDDKITYRFVAQSFTNAYVEAWKRYSARLASSLKSVSAVKNEAKTGEFTKFEYTSLNNASLTQEEEDALLKIDNFAYSLWGYSNLGELHKKIKVVVSDNPTSEQTLKRRIKESDIDSLIDYYNAQISQIKENPDLDENDQDLKNYQYSLNALKSFQIKCEDGICECSMDPFGLYDDATKTVYLFKNRLGSYKNFLCSIYVHEMFHAYFHSGDKYIPEIEEPIVDCSAIRFLREMTSTDDYKAVVANRKSWDFGYYGFGDMLDDASQYDWADLYLNGLKSIDSQDESVKKLVSTLTVYPYAEVQKTLDLFAEILAPNEETSSYSSYNQFLIIEEINRGNCAQIFGDVFQLLDRDNEGFSKYEIAPDSDLQRYIAKQNLNVSGVKNAHGKDISNEINSGKLLKLPNNIYIWATMNTSDQSLFPMDSAFKRRWDWEYVRVEHDDAKKFHIFIGGKSYNWDAFIIVVNKKIFGATQSADKQLGNRFCKDDVLLNPSENDKNKREFVITTKKFINKVMFYLWEEVCKDAPEEEEINFMRICERLNTPNNPVSSKHFIFQDLFEGVDYNDSILQKEVVLQMFMNYLGIEPEKSRDLIDKYDASFAGTLVDLEEKLTRIRPTECDSDSLFDTQE